jgi:cell division protein FtsL
MAAVDWFAHAAEVAEPVPVRRRPARTTQRRPATPARSRRKPAQRRVRAHIVWMIAFALLLAGVVAVNVAVLRAHVAVSRLDEKRAQLQARNQALASELSQASSAPQIERAARRLGLVQASAGNTSYTDLTAPRR